MDADEFLDLIGTAKRVVACGQQRSSRGRSYPCYCLVTSDPDLGCVWCSQCSRWLVKCEGCTREIDMGGVCTTIESRCRFNT